jgi:hypothetical protein
VTPPVALTRLGLPGAGPRRPAGRASVNAPASDPPGRAALPWLVEGVSAGVPVFTWLPGTKARPAQAAR